MTFWLGVCAIVVGWVLFKLGSRRADRHPIDRIAADDALAPHPKISFTIETRSMREPRERQRYVQQPAWPDEDDDYADFVRQKWLLPGSEIGLTLTRQRAEGPSSFWLKSVVRTASGTIYVNGIEESRKISLAGDGRHRWEYQGRAVDTSAFAAMLAGISPETALQPEAYPATVAEALTPEKNRAEPQANAFIISYENAAGHRSYRVISGVRRDTDGFSAICHFRWGSRRDFRFDRLREVVDFETGEEIPIDDFRKKPRSKAKPRRKNPLD